MYFPQKVFYGVFELPLLRNARKRHKKNQKNQQQKKVPTYPIYHLPGIRRFQFYFSSAPLGRCTGVGQGKGKGARATSCLVAHPSSAL
jgi:hypothetical protein